MSDDTQAAILVLVAYIFGVGHASFMSYMYNRKGRK